MTSHSPSAPQPQVSPDTPAPTIRMLPSPRQTMIPAPDFMVEASR